MNDIRNPLSITSSCDPAIASCLPEEEMPASSLTPSLSTNQSPQDSQFRLSDVTQAFSRIAQETTRSVLTFPALFASSSSESRIEAEYFRSLTSAEDSTMRRVGEIGLRWITEAPPEDQESYEQLQLFTFGLNAAPYLTDRARNDFLNAYDGALALPPAERAARLEELSRRTEALYQFGAQWSEIVALYGTYGSTLRQIEEREGVEFSFIDSWEQLGEIDEFRPIVERLSQAGEYGELNQLVEDVYLLNITEEYLEVDDWLVVGDWIASEHPLAPLLQADPSGHLRIDDLFAPLAREATIPESSFEVATRDAAWMRGMQSIYAALQPENRGDRPVNEQLLLQGLAQSLTVAPGFTPEGLRRLTAVMVRGQLPTGEEWEGIIRSGLTDEIGSGLVRGRLEQGIEGGLQGACQVFDLLDSLQNFEIKRWSEQAWNSSMSEQESQALGIMTQAIDSRRDETETIPDDRLLETMEGRLISTTRLVRARQALIIHGYPIPEGRFDGVRAMAGDLEETLDYEALVREFAETSPEDLLRDPSFAERTTELLLLQDIMIRQEMLVQAIGLMDEVVSSNWLDHTVNAFGGVDWESTTRNGEIVFNVIDRRGARDTLREMETLFDRYCNIRDDLWLLRRETDPEAYERRMGEIFQRLGEADSNSLFGETTYWTEWGRENLQDRADVRDFLIDTAASVLGAGIGSFITRLPTLVTWGRRVVQTVESVRAIGRPTQWVVNRTLSFLGTASPEAFFNSLSLEVLNAAFHVPGSWDPNRSFSENVGAVGDRFAGQMLFVLGQRGLRPIVQERLLGPFRQVFAAQGNRGGFLRQLIGQAGDRGLSILGEGAILHTLQVGQAVLSQESSGQEIEWDQLASWGAFWAAVRDGAWEQLNEGAAEEVGRMAAVRSGSGRVHALQQQLEPLLDLVESPTWSTLSPAEQQDLYQRLQSLGGDYVAILRAMGEGQQVIRAGQMDGGENLRSAWFENLLTVADGVEETLERVRSQMAPQTPPPAAPGGSSPPDPAAGPVVAHMLHGQVAEGTPVSQTGAEAPSPGEFFIGRNPGEYGTTPPPEWHPLIERILTGEIDERKLREEFSLSEEELPSIFSQAIEQCCASDDGDAFGERLNLLIGGAVSLDARDAQLVRRFVELIDDPRFFDQARVEFLDWLPLLVGSDQESRQAATEALLPRQEALLTLFPDASPYIRLASIVDDGLQTAFLSRAFELFLTPLPGLFSEEDADIADIWSDAENGLKTLDDEYSNLGREGRELAHAFMIRILDTEGLWRPEVADFLAKDVIPHLDPAEAQGMFDDLARNIPLTSSNFQGAFRLFRKLFYRIPLGIHLGRLTQDAPPPGHAMEAYLYAGGEPDFSQFSAWSDHPQPSLSPADASMTVLQRTLWLAEQMLRYGAFRHGSTTIPCGDYDFEMSPVFRAGDRLIAFAIVTNRENPLERRLRFFYHSRSQGAWRVTPFLDNGRLVKGDHYTAITQLAQPLVEYLSAVEPQNMSSTQRDRLSHLFEIREPFLEEEYRQFLQDDFEGAFQNYASPSLQTVIELRPGSVFEESEGATPFSLETLSQLELPEGFVPDFRREPTSRREFNHDLLGPCIEWTYGGASLDGHPIEWNIAMDGAGRIWVQSIRFIDERINSYGGSNQFVDAGILQYKPLDYGSQLGRLPFYERVHFDQTYYDISSVLAQLPPIREFILHSGQVLPGPGLDALQSAWSPDEGIFRLPDGRILDARVHAVTDLPAPLRGDPSSFPGEFHATFEGNDVFMTLTYPDGYRLSLQSSNGGSRITTEAEGPNFHYEETLIGGLAGFERALNRFLYCIRRSKGLLPEQNEDERRGRQDRGMVRWIRNLVNGRDSPVDPDVESSEESQSGSNSEVLGALLGPMLAVGSGPLAGFGEMFPTLAAIAGGAAILAGGARVLFPRTRDWLRSRSQTSLSQGETPPVPSAAASPVRSYDDVTGRNYTVYGIRHEHNETAHDAIRRLIREAYADGARSVGLETSQEMLEDPNRYNVFTLYAEYAGELGMRVIPLEQEANRARRIRVDAAQGYIDATGSFNRERLKGEIRDLERALGAASSFSPMESIQGLTQKLSFLRDVEAVLESINYDLPRYAQLWEATVRDEANREMFSAIRSENPDIVFMGNAHVETLQDQMESRQVINLGGVLPDLGFTPHDPDLTIYPSLATALSDLDELSRQYFYLAARQWLEDAAAGDMAVEDFYHMIDRACARDPELPYLALRMNQRLIRPVMENVPFLQMPVDEARNRFSEIMSGMWTPVTPEEAAPSDAPPLLSTEAVEEQSAPIRAGLEARDPTNPALRAARIDLARYAAQTDGPATVQRLLEQITGQPPSRFSQRLRQIRGRTRLVSRDDEAFLGSLFEGSRREAFLADVAEFRANPARFPTNRIEELQATVHRLDRTGGLDRFGIGLNDDTLQTLRALVQIDAMTEAAQEFIWAERSETHRAAREATVEPDDFHSFASLLGPALAAGMETARTGTLGLIATGAVALAAGAYILLRGRGRDGEMAAGPVVGQNDAPAMTPGEQLRRDIESFGWSADRFSDLTPEQLESLRRNWHKFESGSQVSFDSQNSPDTPDGTTRYVFDFVDGEGKYRYRSDATSADYEAYLAWRRERGFSDRARATVESTEYRDLETFLRSYGIGLTINQRLGIAHVSPAQLRYIHAALSLLPPSLLGNSYLREIRLRDEPPLYAGNFGTFENGAAYLYFEAFRGSRQNLIGLLLHELGHSTAERYALSAEENRDGMPGAGAPPDETIPFEIRSQMHDDLRTITGGDSTHPFNFNFALDWLFGNREFYTSTFSDFIAEFHLNYVVAGPALREHINNITDPAQREAYQRIYNEIRDRIFDGMEYGEGGVPFREQPSSTPDQAAGPIEGGSDVMALAVTDFEEVTRQVIEGIRGAALEAAQAQVRRNSPTAQSEDTLPLIVRIDLATGRILEPNEAAYRVATVGMTVFPRRNRIYFADEATRAAVESALAGTTAPAERAVLGALVQMSEMPLVPATQTPENPLLEDMSDQALPPVDPQVLADNERHLRRLVPSPKMTMSALFPSFWLLGDDDFMVGRIHLDESGRITSSTVSLPEYRTARGTTYSRGVAGEHSAADVILANGRIVWHGPLSHLNPTQQSEMLALTDTSFETLRRYPYTIDGILGEGMGPLAVDLAGTFGDAWIDAGEIGASVRISIVAQNGVYRAYRTDRSPQGLALVATLNADLTQMNPGSLMSRQVLQRANFEFSADLSPETREEIEALLRFTIDRLSGQGTATPADSNSPATDQSSPSLNSMLLGPALAAGVGSFADLANTFPTAAAIGGAAVALYYGVRDFLNRGRNRGGEADDMASDFGPLYALSPEFLRAIPAEGIDVADVRLDPVLDLEGREVPLEGYLGHQGTIRFTGRIFGQGSGGTIYEAYLDDGNADPVQVAVKIPTRRTIEGIPLETLVRQWEGAARRERENLRFASDHDIGRTRYYGEVLIDGLLGSVMNVAPGSDCDVVDPAWINHQTLRDLYRLFSRSQELGRGIAGDFQYRINREGRVFLIDHESTFAHNELPSNALRDAVRYLRGQWIESGRDADEFDRMVEETEGELGFDASGVRLVEPELQRVIGEEVEGGFSFEHQDLLTDLLEQVDRAFGIRELASDALIPQIELFSRQFVRAAQTVFSGTTVRTEIPVEGQLFTHSQTSEFHLNSFLAYYADPEARTDLERFSNPEETGGIIGLEASRFREELGQIEEAVRQGLSAEELAPRFEALQGSWYHRLMTAYDEACTRARTALHDIELSHVAASLRSGGTIEYESHYRSLWELRDHIDLTRPGRSFADLAPEEILSFRTRDAETATGTGSFEIEVQNPIARVVQGITAVALGVATFYDLIHGGDGSLGIGMAGVLPFVASGGQSHPIDPLRQVMATMGRRMAERNWIPSRFRGSGRIEDLALTTAARGERDPRSGIDPNERRLLELAQRVNADGNPTHEAQDLRDLLGYFSTTRAPELAWVWIRALAISIRTEAFDQVVQTTVDLYRQAERRGIHLSGSVIETLARTSEEVLRWLAGRSGNPERLIRNARQGALGELRVLRYLLQQRRAPLASLRVIPRSPTGNIRTPDFEIRFVDQDVSEFWDVKTSRGTHGVDADQFRGLVGDQRARLILLGGSFNDGNTEGDKGIHIDHLPSLNPTTAEFSQELSLP